MPIMQLCAKELRKAFDALSTGTEMGEHLIEINRLEEVADQLVRSAISDLFQNEKRPILVMRLKEVYEFLEQTTDACEVSDSGSWSQSVEDATVVVRQRAGSLCEYCRLHQTYSDLVHHVEHIVARQDGGSDDPDNLALACPGATFTNAQISPPSILETASLCLCSTLAKNIGPIISGLTGNGSSEQPQPAALLSTCFR